MKLTWQNLDLTGGGLQAANIRLAQRLRKPIIAYALWILFPVGAHCAYLAAPKRSVLYTALSGLSAVLYLTTPAWYSGIPIIGAGLLALYDLRWIGNRLVEINKQIRMQVYLGQTAGAPEHFKGHYTDEAESDAYIREKKTERPGHGDDAAESRRRAPSLAEQEATLRKLAKGEK